MVWSAGQSGNANGRPTGSRNKRTEDLWRRLEARGDRDPIEFQSEIASDQTVPLETRLQAANNITPYRYGKHGALPPLRFIEHPFEYPHPNPATEGEISTNIGALNQAYAAGTLDLDSYQTMLAGQHSHVQALKAREEIPADQNITITGGLPSLPGCNITMPQLNGHEFSVLAAPVPVLDPPQNESVPSTGVDP